MEYLLVETQTFEDLNDVKCECKFVILFVFVNGWHVNFERKCLCRLKEITLLLVVTLGLGPHPATTPLMHNVDTQMRENVFLWMLTCLIWAKSLGVASIPSCHNAITTRRPGPASPGHSPSAAAPGSICSGVSSFCRKEKSFTLHCGLILSFTSHKEQLKLSKMQNAWFNNSKLKMYLCTLLSKWRIILL